MTFLFFDGPALTETWSLCFENGLAPELDGEGDLDRGDGDGGFEKGGADALVTAVLHAATMLSIHFTTNGRTVTVD